MNDPRAQIRQFIVDNFLLSSQAAQFADSDSFLHKRIVDSTGFLEVIGFLEDTWHITVADDEMIPENLDSVDALVAYLARKTA